MNAAADPKPDPVTSERVGSLHAQVKAIYASLDQEIERLAPVCKLSGRCCRFTEYGHTLFLSKPELEVLLSEAPPPVRSLDEGATCPWQDSKGRCTAREARPLGCRVYFCDPRYESLAPELSERYLAELKRLAVLHAVPWNYAPLHRHLHQAVEEEVFDAVIEPTSGASVGPASS